MAGSRRRDIEEGRASGSRQVQRWPEVYFLGRRAARHLHQPLRAGPAVSVPVHAVRGYLRGAEPARSGAAGKPIADAGDEALAALARSEGRADGTGGFRTVRYRWSRG